MTHNPHASDEDLGRGDILFAVLDLSEVTLITVWAQGVIQGEKRNTIKDREILGPVPFWSVWCNMHIIWGNQISLPLPLMIYMLPQTRPKLTAPKKRAKRREKN